MHPCTYQNSTAIIVDGFGVFSPLFARSLLSSSLSCQFTASHLIFAPLCTSGLIKCSCKKNLSCLDVIIDPEPAPSCGQETSRQIVLCHWPPMWISSVLRFSKGNKILIRINKYIRQRGYILGLFYQTYLEYRSFRWKNYCNTLTLLSHSQYLFCTNHK